MTEDTPKNVGRRNFIKGVIAAGAAASSASVSVPLDAAVRHSSRLRQGSAERLLTLNVNGQDRRVDVPKNQTLATTLRYSLGLTGTKIGCDTVPPAGRARLPRADMCRGIRCSLCSRTWCVAIAFSVTVRNLRESGPDAAPGAAGRGGRAGLPVRVLHVRFRHGRGRLPEDECQPDAAGTRALDLGQSLPMPGLRQDPTASMQQRAALRGEA